MYHAIVFLPLLGAILAALIALVGARARHPGGSPTVGEDHRHDAAGAGHVHAAPAYAHAPQPAAAGSRAAELATTLFLFIAMLLSWLAFVDVGFAHHDIRVTLFPWIVSGDLKIDRSEE